MAGTFTNLLYHLVFSTKNRVAYITEPIREELFRYMGGIIKGEGGIALEINGMPDHVHLLVKLKSQPALSEILRKVKGSSSHWLNERTKSLHKFGWQDGYAAFSVSESAADAVRKYIRNQQEHHRKLSFKEEFKLLLEKHGVEYDERYLID